MEIQYGDMIEKLPSDDSQPSHNELQIVNTLFKKHTSDMKSIATEFSEPAIIAGLVVFLWLPPVDNAIKNFFPSITHSPLLLVATKAFFIGVLFWLIKHFYLSRRLSLQ